MTDLAAQIAAGVLLSLAGFAFGVLWVCYLVVKRFLLLKRAAENSEEGHAEFPLPNGTFLFVRLSGCGCYSFGVADARAHHEENEEEAFAE